MCDQTEINYSDGDIVWVKLGSCWWPGEVVGSEKLPSDLLASFRKPPIAVVKFFQEDIYEYVKNHNAIYKYECSRKTEFIQKGLHMYRRKHGLLEKFPEDVIRAETAVGGDIEILTRDEFQETKKESYADLFGDSKKKTPGSRKKGKSFRGRPSNQSPLSTPIRKIKQKTDYKAHILVQGSKTPNQPDESTPSTSRAGSEPPAENTENQDKSEEMKIESPKSTLISTPVASSSGIYACHACPFTTTRLNVLVIHNKTHSASFTPYIPTPIKKKVVVKTTKSPKSPTNTPKQTKPKKTKQEKTEKTPKKKGVKRELDVKSENIPEVKKVKTDEEIKSSLLADWDDGDEDSVEESLNVATGASSDEPVAAVSPDVPVAVGSPAIPTPAEPSSEQDVIESVQDKENKKDTNSPSDKPEPSNEDNYEFCEDEDWPEADVGRKIPRVKPLKRKEETKSSSIDENEMAREVAELLNKTTVPELPSVPEPLKVEENFPEPSIVKSPDKKNEKPPEDKSVEKPAETDVQQQRPIFKTKTFFRSRHSRSQDAIGKYVAEQLNAAERHDMVDTDINGSEMTPSPELRLPSPIEPVKVAKLAPKIQLKKMNAEAAQLREKEKIELEKEQDESPKKDILNTENLNFDDKIVEESIHVDSSNQPKKIAYGNFDVYKDDITKVESGDIITMNKENEQCENPIIQNNVDTVQGILEPTKENSISKESSANDDKPYSSYMSESTASAVDALLSVSREADRVTKVISVDPPEDLFEDDNKDNYVNNRCEDNLIVNSNIEVTSKLHETESANQNNNSNEAILEGSEQVKTKTSSESENDLKSVISENIHPEAKITHTDTERQPIANETIEELDTENPDTLDLKNKSETTHDNVSEIITNSTPSESDLQIAEALINLPSTTIQTKVTLESPDNLLNLSPVNTDHMTQNTNTIENNVLKQSPIKSDSLNEAHVDENLASDGTILTGTIRFESEEEKSENLNAAQSLVQMSESVDHQIKITEINSPPENVGSSIIYSTKQNMSGNNNILKIETSPSTVELKQEAINGNSIAKGSPKLLRILEEPSSSRVPLINNSPPSTKIVVSNKEKILNIEANQMYQSLKPKQQTKQKIIIRRTIPHKTLLNNVTEVISKTPDKIILSRTNKVSADGSSVQRYMIQTAPDEQTDKNAIVIQQKVKKITKPAPKFQKIKPQTTAVPSLLNNKLINNESSSEPVFDINSMPIVLSDELLTPESIEKMPIVMSDGNVITSSSNKPVRNKKIITPSEKITVTSSKHDGKAITSLISTHDKITTPNILSKSSKLRSKPVLIIDKTTGKQKLLMPKSDTPQNEIKQPPKLIQASPQSTAKQEKIVIVPTPTPPRPARTQKIVIDPQTGKAHVVVDKAPTPAPVSNNAPVSAKLIPSASDAKTPGNTVMIITNAQGTQSTIVLTPEHEKILFPNKQQNVTQLKTITQRITQAPSQLKPIVTTVTPPRTQTKIVSKQQKNAIITSKGQLIVGGRLATTTQNIAPLPELRPATKRITSEPKKIVSTIQKPANESFFLQKSGAVVQLTAAQFEHLQRTGQIIQKVMPAQENKVIQKTITMPATETATAPVQKSRARKQNTESLTPTKKIKHEIAIAPALTPISTPASYTSTNNMSVATNVNITTSSPAPPSLTGMQNYEELLPTTAIARPTEAVVSQPEPVAQQPVIQLSEGQQLAAVPGENFGGPPGSFYLCIEENGSYTAIDNCPLILENNQLVPMSETMSVITPQPERRDILEAALANSDVFQAETTHDEAPDFRDLNANVSVHCRVSETSTTLNQPIMTPVEVPTKGNPEPAVPTNLDDGLAVIGVSPHTVPTSLELPITVTDPRIAPKTTDPLSNNNYRTSLLPSPNTEMAFVVTEETDGPIVGPISMPLLTEEESVGKSMPILIDEITERTISSVESTMDSPSFIDIRESETEDGSQWARRLLTPGSDISEASVEIPLQPALQLSVSDVSHSS